MIVHIGPRWLDQRCPFDTQNQSEPLHSECGGCLLSQSGVSHSATPWTAARQASLSFTISRSLLNLKSFELVMPVWR